MYKLPLACIGCEVGMQVGSTVREAEDINVPDDGVGWGEFLRVKICIDLSKPLARGELLRCRGRRYGWPSNMRKFLDSVSNLWWSCTTIKNVVNMEVGKHRK